MNIESIAARALVTALASIAKGGDEFAKGAGKDLWELIKKPFTRGKNKNLIQTLEKNPGDEKIKKRTESKLVEFLKENHSLASDIEEACKRISELRSQKDNTLTVKGNSNITIQNTTNSSIVIKK